MFAPIAPKQNNHDVSSHRHSNWSGKVKTLTDVTQRAPCFRELRRAQASKAGLTQDGAAGKPTALLGAFAATLADPSPPPELRRG